MSDPQAGVSPIGGPPALLIPAAIHDAMVAHCRREAPLEACGLLAGEAPRVARIYPLRNAEASPIRYNADSRDLLAAQKDMRRRGIEIVGIYHSHPKGEAFPSRIDKGRNQHLDTPQLIVSLLGEPEVRAWQIDSDPAREIPWRLVADDEPLAVEPATATG